MIRLSAVEGAERRSRITDMVVPSIESQSEFSLRALISPADWGSMRTYLDTYKPSPTDATNILKYLALSTALSFIAQATGYKLSGVEQDYSQIAQIVKDNVDYANHDLRGDRADFLGIALEAAAALRQWVGEFKDLIGEQSRDTLLTLAVAELGDLIAKNDYPGTQLEFAAGIIGAFPWMDSEMVLPNSALPFINESTKAAPSQIKFIRLANLKTVKPDEVSLTPVLRQELEETIHTLRKQNVEDFIGIATSGAILSAADIQATEHGLKLIYSRRQEPTSSTMSLPIRKEII